MNTIPLFHTVISYKPPHDWRYGATALFCTRRTMSWLSTQPEKKLFEYKALDYDRREFRLFKILPAKNQSNSLEVRLTSASLNNPPSFAVLSYIWQSSRQNHRMFCPGTQINIPVGAMSALLSARRFPRRHELFWMDSICINQEDADERGSQVRMMPDIFQVATETLCLLSAEVSEVAEVLLSKLATLPSSFDDVNEPIERPTSSQALTTGVRTSIFHGYPKISQCELGMYRSQYMTLEEKLFLGASSDDAWRSILDLVNDDYFRRLVYSCASRSSAHILTPALSRMWLVQEVISSRGPVVRCGSVDIDWPVLASALKAHCLYGHQDVLATEAVTSILTTAMLRDFVQVHSLSAWSALVPLRICHLEATDPRDHVFCPVSFTRDQTEQAQPNYAISIRRSYSRAAKAMDDHHQTHLSLSLSSITSDIPIDLDSGITWVPNFGETCSQFLLNSPESNFAASSKPFRLVYFDPEETIKKVEGLTVDKIQRVGQYLPPRRLKDQYNTCSDNLSIFLDWYQIACGRTRSITDAQYVLVEFAETVQARGCGHLWEPISPRSCSEVEVECRNFLEYLEDEMPVTDQLRIFCAACLPSYDRRLGVTEAGRLCLVPRETTVGDSICVLDGNRVPIVLRRLDGGYVNIGECFVHGIMHGEAAESESLNSEQFSIF